jgi:hypothetical protein
MRGIALSNTRAARTDFDNVEQGSTLQLAKSITYSIVSATRVTANNLAAAYFARN